MPVSQRTDGTSPKSNYELLTATTLIYAIGAGITAAAGTRIALQLFFIDNRFKLFSFQLLDLMGHSQFHNEERSYLHAWLNL